MKASRREAAPAPLLGRAVTQGTKAPGMRSDPTVRTRGRTAGLVQDGQEKHSLRDWAALLCLFSSPQSASWTSSFQV